KATFPAGWVDYVEARVLANQEKWSQARDILESALPALEEGASGSREANREVLKNAYRLLGLCCDKLSDTDRQLAIFDKLANLDSGSTVAKVGRARALEAMGRYDEAFDLVRRITPRTPEIRASLIHLLIRRNLGQPSASRRWDQVQELLDEA